jgi:hypothetical protein
MVAGAPDPLGGTLGARQAEGMSEARGLPALARKVLPWLAGWMAFQVLLAVGGRVAASRLDRGDDSSPDIRRVMTLGGVQLRPGSPTLSRVELDLVMAGGELDLTATPPLPGGVDVVARMAMGGLAIRVPGGWRVWWDLRGVGGIGADPGVERTSDWATADLRLKARVLLGGIGIEAPKD